MAEHDDDSPSPDSSAVPVPELIEQYRSRRQAWMAQADELARLRDEVRGSAEREAMEIVTTARRDIRRIVGEARRDLFVLSAQVQAAVGDIPPEARPMRPALPTPMDERDSADDLSTFAEEEWGFAPRATVKSVLDEALADMAVLAKDASAVQVRPPESATAPAPAVEIPADRHEPEAASGLLLSPFGADEVEARSTRPITPFLIGSVAVGIIVVIGTIWAIRGPASPSSQPAAPEAARTDTPSTVTPQASSAGPAGSTAGTAAAAADSGIRLSLEARRPAWIRAIVDGRPDAGHTLRQGEVQEFRGTRSIALRIGDAGAVLVSVNGEQPRLLGRDGQVVNREFTGGASEPARPGPVQPSAAGAPEPAPAPEIGSGPAAAAPSPATPIQAASANLSWEAAPSAVIGTNGVEPSSTARTPERAGTTSVSSTSAAGPSATSAAAEATIVAAAQQWLDAYYHQDRGTMASLSTDALIVTDERPTAERFPTGVGTVVRTLERVNVRAAADTAVLTGIMVERAAGGGLQRSSPVSLLWVSGSGTWRLWQARLVSESRLNQIFR